jgi:hypothetical protein
MKNDEDDEQIGDLTAEEQLQEQIHEDIKGEIELDDFDENTPDY